MAINTIRIYHLKRSLWIEKSGFQTHTSVGTIRVSTFVLVFDETLRTMCGFLATPHSLLNWGALDGAIATEYATITLFRLQDRFAAFAFVKVLAGIQGNCFFFLMTAFWAGYYGLRFDGHSICFFTEDYRWLRIF